MKGQKEEATEVKDSPLLRLCIDTAPPTALPKRSNQFSESQRNLYVGGIPKEPKILKVQQHIREVVDFSMLNAQKASQLLVQLQNSVPLKVTRTFIISLQMTSKSLDASLKNMFKNPHWILLSGKTRMVI